MTKPFKPLPSNLELKALLKRAAEIQAAMTPAQKAEQSLRQAVSYVRGEMGMEHPEWSEERLNEVTRHMPQAWALAEIDRLRRIEAAARNFIDNSPTGDDDQPYCSDVAQSAFKALYRSLQTSEASGSTSPLNTKDGM